MCEKTLSRRALIGSGAALGAAGLASAAAQDQTQRQGRRRRQEDGLPAVAPTTRQGFTALSPDDALQLLIDGNDAFLNDTLPEPPTGAQRRLELARGQAPFCAYVTCSDSRVPPELLFGRGLGELFIIRNAGNTVDTVAMGSIEYAVAELKVPLVVVMGHESCGAVGAAKAVVDSNARFPGKIDDMIQPIIPAVLDVRKEDGSVDLADAVRQNVRRVVNELRNESDPLLIALQRAGRLKVVGAYYNLETGFVEFFDRP